MFRFWLSKNEVRLIIQGKDKSQIARILLEKLEVPPEQIEAADEECLNAALARLRPIEDLRALQRECRDIALGNTESPLVSIPETPIRLRTETVLQNGRTLKMDYTLVPAPQEAVSSVSSIQ